MERISTNQNRLLEVEYIQEKLDEGYRYTEEAKGRDLVLVIGNTGVGKSTTCNYLSCHSMREAMFNMRPVIETAGETNIKIGHEVEAETLYAKTVLVDHVFSSGEGSTCMCLLDCPGFLGNRTIEDRVIESISTELAIRNARQIKGILILISLNNLLETRLTELRELVKTLISLFKDPVEMVQYSVFVITKKYKRMPDSEASDIVIGTLNSLKDHCEKQAKYFYEHQNLGSSEGLTYVDYDRIATYFSAVLATHKNIVFINPLDDGESRELIYRHINGIKPRRGYLKELAKGGLNLLKNTVGMNTNQNLPVRPITINDFSFSNYDEYRVKFNKTIYDRAHDGHVLICNIQEYREINLNLHSEIHNYQKRLSMLKELQANLIEESGKADEDKSRFLKIDFQSIENVKALIDENNNYMRSLENEVSQILMLRAALRNELDSINCDDPLVFMQKSMDKYVSWYKLFGWEEMSFVADTGDRKIQIIEVSKEKVNGNWIDEDNRMNEGFYKIIYASNYRARPAKASVTAYIKTKDEAGNKIRINEIKSERTELHKKQGKLKSKISSLKSNNEILQSTIELATSSKEAYKNNLKQKLKECDEDIDHHNSLIVKMQEDREEARLAGLASLQEFGENKRKFDIVVSIADVLEFPSFLIKRFISQYKEFLSDIDTYKCIFGDSNVNLDFVPHKIKNDEIVDLKDPISGEEIKDLVVTQAGTLFDAHSLLKQFDTSKDNILPFVFEHEDGTSEEIKYFSWTKIPDIQSYLNKQRNRKFSQTSSSFTMTEINQMTANQLKEQKDGLVQEIYAMREQLEVKQTELEKICRQLKKVSGIEGEENLLTFYAKSEINQKTVDLFVEQTCNNESRHAKIDEFEIHSSVSVAENDVKVAVPDNLLIEKPDQEVQTSDDMAYLDTSYIDQAAEMKEIPSDNKLSLNSLSSNLCDQDSEISESLNGFDLIPENVNLNISNFDNDPFSDAGSVNGTNDSVQNVDNFNSSEISFSDSSNTILDNDDMLNKHICPCGVLKNTVTFPCKHFYFCDKCAPKFFEFYHRCSVCKCRIKSYDKIF